MAKTYHCRVLKPFDRYDNVGAVAVLSATGFQRMTSSKNFGGHIEVLAVENDNGDVEDAKGNVVLASKDRKGEPVDAIAIAEQAKGAPIDDLAPTNREQKPARTRG